MQVLNQPLPVPDGIYDFISAGQKFRIVVDNGKFNIYTIINDVSTHRAMGTTCAFYPAVWPISWTTNQTNDR